MSLIFGPYDAEALEDQYMPVRWKMRSIPSLSEDWRNRSLAFRERSSVEIDISYGRSKRQTMDVYRPAYGGNVPMMAFIHGGYWRSLRFDKTNYSFCIEPLVKAGALVAMIEYELCPEVSLETLVAQIREACAWLWRNAQTYGGDRNRLHVAGHSAGGHLAAMMAVTDWARLGEDLPDHMIKSIVPVSGLFELEPLRLTSINAELRLDSEGARRHSPTFMQPRRALPVSVIVGGGETDEFRRQSRDFADSWRHIAGPVSYLETSGHDHFAVIEAMTELHDPTSAILLRHLAL